MNNIEEQIKEIIREYCDGDALNVEVDGTLYWEDEPKLIKELSNLLTQAQEEAEIGRLVNKLSEPVKHNEKYYYLAMSKTRCWYETPDGEGLEYVDEQGRPITEFVRGGEDLVSALQNMEQYLSQQREKGKE